MYEMKRKGHCLLLVVLASLGLYGCGTQALGATEETAHITAISLLDRSAQAMKTVSSYHFVEVSGGSSENSVELEGDFASPDSERLFLKCETRGSMQMLRLGNDRYVRHDSETSYQQVPVELASGLMPAARIVNNMKAAEEGSIVGDEHVEGVDTIHVTFVYDARPGQIEVPADITGLEETHAHVWIETDTFYVRKYGIASSKAEQLDTIVTFSKFNELVLPPMGKPTDLVAPLAP